MSPEIREAIEAAVSGPVSQTPTTPFGGPRRRMSFSTARALLYAVAQELPGGLTVAELCDELCNANNQGGFDVL